MQPGFLVLRTVMNPTHIVSYGIDQVISKIHDACASAHLTYNERKWRTFWKYFQLTWIEKYDPKLWNVHGLDNSLITHTNNPLEQFNRIMHAVFRAGRSTLPVFISKINISATTTFKTSKTFSRTKNKNKKRCCEYIKLPSSAIFDVPTISPSDDEECNQEHEGKHDQEDGGATCDILSNGSSHSSRHGGQDCANSTDSDRSIASVDVSNRFEDYDVDHLFEYDSEPSGSAFSDSHISEDYDNFGWSL